DHPLAMTGLSRWTLGVRYRFALLSSTLGTSAGRGRRAGRGCSCGRLPPPDLVSTPGLAPPPVGSRRRRSANRLRHRGRARYRSSGTTDPRNLQATPRRRRQDVLASTSCGLSGSGTRDAAPPQPPPTRGRPAPHHWALDRSETEHAYASDRLGLNQ